MGQQVEGHGVWGGESASPFVPGELKHLLIWRWAADLQDVFSEWKLVIIVHAL